MTVSFTAGNYAVSAKPIDLITSAYTEIGYLAAGEVLSGQDAAWGLEKLQRLIDQFNAQQALIYNVNFSTANLIPNHSPHTIGPTGDINVPIRPVKIVSASFVLNSGSSNPVDIPIGIRDDDWWAANPLKSQTNTISTDLYYSPDSPLGQAFFWPICTVAGVVRLETWVNLAQAIDLNTAIGFPAGYWDAIVLTLARRLWPSCFPNLQLSPELIAAHTEAMRSIIQNNDKPPRIDTSAGMPGAKNPGRPDFNFLTGLRE